MSKPVSYPICETHKVEMVRRGECPKEERFMGCKRFIGVCSVCGKEIIVPHPHENYGSIKNLKEDNYMGDIDPHDLRCYCFKCMRGRWSWGQKEEDNTEKDGE